jgi:hypothetical protein
LDGCFVDGVLNNGEPVEVEGGNLFRVLLLVIVVFNLTNKTLEVYRPLSKAEHLIIFIGKMASKGQFIHFFVSLQSSLGLIFIHVDTFKKSRD